MPRAARRTFQAAWPRLPTELCPFAGRKLHSIARRGRRSTRALTGAKARGRQKRVSFCAPHAPPTARRSPNFRRPCRPAIRPRRLPPSFHGGLISSFLQQPSAGPCPIGAGTSPAGHPRVMCGTTTPPPGAQQIICPSWSGLWRGTGCGAPEGGAKRVMVPYLAYGATNPVRGDQSAAILIAALALARMAGCKGPGRSWTGELRCAPELVVRRRGPCPCKRALGCISWDGTDGVLQMDLGLFMPVLGAGWLVGAECCPLADRSASPSSRSKRPLALSRIDPSWPPPDTPRRILAATRAQATKTGKSQP